VCDTCGCGATEVRVVKVGQDGVESITHTHDGVTHTHAVEGEHTHADGTSHVHGQPHIPPVVPASHSHDGGSTTVTLELDVLGKNDALAEENRAWLLTRGIVAINVMSSPGAGKTSLLERTIRDLSDRREIAVIEGDQETLLDAERITAAGARAVQVNTGAGCHLDAEMVRGALNALAPGDGSLVFVENVGNLVCPALFDLGERAKVVVISVTEGDDKPLKYPHMFAAADLVVLNKIDLLPYVDFDVAALTRHARAVKPDVEVIPLSVRTGADLDLWYRWLAGRM
jgi:hydrogenase nickel incorporation protein HypB